MLILRLYGGRTDFGGVLAGFFPDLADRGALRASLTNYFRDMQSFHSPKGANEVVL